MILIAFESQKVFFCCSK